MWVLGIMILLVCVMKCCVNVLVCVVMVLFVNEWNMFGSGSLIMVLICVGVGLVVLS